MVLMKSHIGNTNRLLIVDRLLIVYSVKWLVCPWYILKSNHHDIITLLLSKSREVKSHSKRLKI